MLNSPNGGSFSLIIWAAFGCAAGANTVTLTLAATTFDATFSEYSGINAVDKTAVAQGVATTNPNSGATATTTQGDEMVLGFVTGASAASTAGAGFTRRANGANNTFVSVEDLRVTATGAQTATFVSSAQNWNCACVTFKETAG